MWKYTALTFRYILQAIGFLLLSFWIYSWFFHSYFASLLRNDYGYLYVVYEVLAAATATTCIFAISRRIGRAFGTAFSIFSYAGIILLTPALYLIYPGVTEIVPSLILTTSPKCVEQADGFCILIRNDWSYVADCCAYKDYLIRIDRDKHSRSSIVEAIRSKSGNETCEIKADYVVLSVFFVEAGCS